MGKRLAAICTSVVWLAALSFVNASHAGARSDVAWRNLDKRVQPPPATGSVMAYHEANDQMVMFGGVGETVDPIGTWVRDGGGWRKASPPVQPADRYGASMVYNAATEQTIMFGGYVWDDAAQRYVAVAETWAWDGDTWAQLSPTSSPSPRAVSGMAYDAANNEVVLFGGMEWSTGSPVEAGDTWTFDGTTWTQETTSIAPSARTGPGMTFHDALGRVVLFGGAGEGTGVPCTFNLLGVCFKLDPTARGHDGMKADTWTWDGSKWMQVATAHAPDKRTAMHMAYEPDSQSAVIFSGVNISQLFEDTWAFDGTDWIDVTPADSPEGRFGAGFATDTDKDELVLFGGHRISYLGSDTWTFDDGTWTTADVLTPKPRFGPSLVYDDVRDEIVMFGGDADHVFADTWVYRDSWQKLSPVASPPGRAQAGEAFDAARGETIVFGGQALSGDDLGDTWAFDGTSWVDRSPELPALAPLARRGAAMTYDAAAGETVMFGGWNTDLGIVFPDTWIWDGSSWSVAPTLVSPPSVYDAAMAFDPKRGQVVLFGGIDGDNQLSNQTWLWDGSTWTQAQPATSPPARSSAGMTYVPELETVVMMGGIGGDEGMWEWDGTNWSHFELPDGPLRRSWPGFAYGEAVGGAFLFGGARSGYLSDTWVLTGRAL